MDTSATEEIQKMSDVDELIEMSSAIETLNPWKQAKFRSLIQDFKFGILGNAELIRDVRLLFREKDNLRDPKIDEKPKENPIHHNDPKIRAGPQIRVNPKKDVTNHGFGKIDSERKTKGRSEAKQKLTELLKAIEERLSPSEMRIYTSLCKDFKSHRIAYGKFVESLLVLIQKYKNLYQRFVEIAYGDKEKQEDEAGETRDSLSDPKIGTRLKIRVKVDKNPQEGESDKTNLEGKNKKRILFPKDSNQCERPLKKRRTSKPFERVTPNYRLIPKELQSPVSFTVLNNTCVLRRHDIQGGKELTGIEKEMEDCEDHMYEGDMLMEALRSAVESAGRVMKGEMRLEDLGVKFYRCVEVLYGGDMFEIVTEDHQRALPVILRRLNQKLREIKAARKSLKPVWKKTFEKLSAKQKDSIARDSEVKKTTI